MTESEPLLLLASRLLGLPQMMAPDGPVSAAAGTAEKTETNCILIITQ